MKIHKVLGFRNTAAMLIVGVLLMTPIPSVAFTTILETLYRAQESVVEVQVSGTGVYQTGAEKTPQNFKLVKFVKKGTGVVIDPEGLILTNAHIVDSKGSIEVVFNNHQMKAAKLVMFSPNEDLALVKIEGQGSWQAFELADDSYIKLRNKVYTVGGSDYTENTISEGKITGIAESASKGKYPGSPEGIIQASFNIYQGDSGSPLLDAEGKLLGIMAASRTRHNKIAYAIPCTTIKAFIQRWRNGQKKKGRFS